MSSYETSDTHLSHLIIAGESVPWFQYERIPSTMDQARNLLKTGIRPWCIVSADTQTDGRGTKGRSWISPMGAGLWCSILLPPPDDPSDMSPTTLLTAEILIKTLRSWTTADFKIKHPNDVLLNGHKIAGILCESVITTDTVTSLILGMGVNLAQKRDQFMRDDLSGATSLFSETGITIAPRTFLREFLANLIPEYEQRILAGHIMSDNNGISK